MLSRIALRLLAVEALAPTGTPDEGPWPTIAKRRIYDSSLVPVDDLSEIKRTPVVIVYTDDTRFTPRQAGGRGPYKGEVDLRFELSVPQLVRDPDQPDSGALVPITPVTDAETEASLDLLEAQVAFALEHGPTGKALRPFLKLKDVKSEAFRTAEERVRLAMRTVTWHLTEVSGDCYDPAPAVAATGLDRLPEPLRGVAKTLPEGSYGRQVALGLAGYAPSNPLRVPLETVGFAIAATTSIQGEVALPQPDSQD